MNLSHYCGEILVHYLHFNSATVDGFQTWKIYSRLFYCIFAVKNLRLCIGHAETPSFCILRHLVTNSFSGRAEWFFFFTHGDSKLSRLLNSRAIPSIHTNPNMFDCTFNLIFCNSRYNIKRAKNYVENCAVWLLPRSPIHPDNKPNRCF